MGSISELCRWTKIKTLVILSLQVSCTQVETPNWGLVKTDAWQLVHSRNVLRDGGFVMQTRVQVIWNVIPPHGQVLFSAVGAPLLEIVQGYKLKTGVLYAASQSKYCTSKSIDM